MIFLIAPCKFGIYRPTKMLCTKVHIYNQPSVDTGGCWCQIISINIFHLSLKIFHWLSLTNSVLKFQIKSGAPKPLSISFFWLFSIYTWNLAPENVCGAQHFSHGVILGQPNSHTFQFSKMVQQKSIKNWWNYLESFL